MELWIGYYWICRSPRYRLILGPFAKITPSTTISLPSIIPNNESHQTNYHVLPPTHYRLLLQTRLRPARPLQVFSLSFRLPCLLQSVHPCHLPTPYPWHHRQCPGPVQPSRSVHHPHRRGQTINPEADYFLGLLFLLLLLLSFLPFSHLPSFTSLAQSLNPSLHPRLVATQRTTSGPLTTLLPILLPSVSLTTPRRLSETSFSSSCPMLDKSLRREVS